MFKNRGFINSFINRIFITFNVKNPAHFHAEKRAQGVVIAPSSNVGYNVQHQQTTAYQYGPPGQPGQQPMNYQYGQPGQGVYPPHPAQPQGPPAYPGQPQTSTDPAYPPPPMEYKQPWNDCGKALLFVIPKLLINIDIDLF